MDNTIELKTTDTSLPDNTLINTSYKDVFISYGRGESLSFAARLHQKITLSGRYAWFDKVNIPHGDDYQKRIDHGIENAQNFLFVIAPHSIRSIYCLLEVIHAQRCGKRIIPILHIMPEDDDWAYAYRKEEAKGNTALCQEVEKAIEQITKTDWIYARETVGNIETYTQWKEGYENEWSRHNEPEYLKKWNCPIQWKAIDLIDSVVQKVIDSIEKQATYVYQHTDILHKARLWTQKQKSSQYLLVGKEREYAEAWLLHEFEDGEQPPCLPSQLHTDFIIESRKNGENLQTDVFICYARQYTEETQQIVNTLHRQLITTWVDLEDIEKGSMYNQEILGGIERADYFLFLISPKSVQSKYCLKELAYAHSLHKKIIPILVAPTADEALPSLIANAQYFQWNHDEDTLLIKQLHAERDYFYLHKLYLNQALKWERQGKNPAILLRGRALEKALAWLDGAAGRNTHLPTEIQKSFIKQSDARRNELEYEVFISYSRKDADFVRKLNQLMELHGRTTWFDQENIPAGAEDFWEEIKKGIDASDNYLFIISPDSITSPFCTKEVQYAQQQGKRILTVKHRSIEDIPLPKELEQINWIDFEGQTDLTRPIGLLLRALDTDREHVKSHAFWDKKAREWAKNTWAKEFYLKKDLLQEAFLWLQTAQKEHKNPAPTLLQKAFIEASQEDHLREESQVLFDRKRKNILTWGFYATVFLVLIATAYLINEKQDAEVEAENHEIMVFHSLAELSKSHGRHALGNKFDKVAFEKNPEKLDRYKASSDFIHRQYGDDVLYTADGRQYILAMPSPYPTLYDQQNNIIREYYDETDYETVDISQINSTAFSTDKKWLCYGSESGLLRLWDLSQDTLYSIQVDQGIQKVVLSKDNTLLAIIPTDGDLLLWDLESFPVDRIVRKILNEGELRQVQFTSDNRYLMALDEEGKLKIWDMNQSYDLAGITSKGLFKTTYYKMERSFFQKKKGKKPSLINLPLAYPEDVDEAPRQLEDITAFQTIGNRQVLIAKNTSIQQWSMEEDSLRFIDSYNYYGDDLKDFAFLESKRLMLLLTESQDLQLMNEFGNNLSSISYGEEVEVNGIDFTTDQQHFKVRVNNFVDVWDLSIIDWDQLYVPNNIDDTALTEFLQSADTFEFYENQYDTSTSNDSSTTYQFPKLQDSSILTK
ncbi:toll/interleukin-1 receptor domain-containing protein [Algivirga pacifica]|uniref:TIR domain-containing protein n=1 Tax=Algivirga pacifica TaxID=1162670 RepID=A0ABP9DJA9_9BACT